MDSASITVTDRAVIDGEAENIAGHFAAIVRRRTRDDRVVIVIERAAEHAETKITVHYGAAAVPDRGRVCAAGQLAAEVASILSRQVVA